MNFRSIMSRELPRSNVHASLCFTRHLNLNPKTPRKLDSAGLEAKVLEDCDAWRLDPYLMGLRWEINKLADEDAENRSHLMRTLVIYAMGGEQERRVILPKEVESPNSHAWSFCKDKWVPRHRTIHCEHCDVCYDLSWHCDTCGTCKAGRMLACDGCGGWSEDGIWNGEDGPKAPDAHMAQRGLSQVSPRKRPRDLKTWNDDVSEVSAQGPFCLYVDSDISLLRLCPKLLMTSRHARVTAKTFVALGAAYVVVGVGVAKKVATVRAEAHVITDSERTGIFSARNHQVNPTGEQRTVLQPTSRKRKSGISAVHFTLAPQTSRWET